MTFRRTQRSSAIPAIRCASTAQPPEGPDTDWIHLPDPVADALSGISDRLRTIEHEIAELQGEEHPPEQSNVRPLNRRKGHDPAGG